MRPSGSARALEQRRLLALRLLSQGVPAAMVAERVRADVRSVRRWRAAVRARGEAAIVAKPALGRPRRLTAAHLARLRSILVEGVRSSGEQAVALTCAGVSRLIERHFGIHYHPAHVNRILHRLGIARPRRCR